MPASWRGNRVRRNVVFGAIAVLGLVMLLVTFATVALVRRVLGRDFLGDAGVTIRVPAEIQPDVQFSNTPPAFRLRGRGVF
jgi:hypothetical protein